MGIFDGLRRDFRSGYEIDWMLDLDFSADDSMRSYLKFMAIDTVLNFVGRTMSTVKIGIESKEWDYILNVRPNSDNSAAAFWQKFFYKLMAKNEILVVVSDDNQLLIADSFYRNEYAVYEDTFTDVIVKDYAFKRTFKMSEVIYVEYNNDKLEKFTKGLFDDSGELYGRILEVAMRNNQIRASVGIDSTGTLKDDKDAGGRTRTEKLQGFINKVYNSYRTNSVAIVPKMKGFEYEEYTNKQGGSNQSIDELNKMVTSLIDDIANMIGVPTALIYGEKSEMDSNIKAYKKLCIIPLAKKLQDELNAKILLKSEYLKGQRVEVFGMLPPDPLELATQADKLVSSGMFYIDEARDMFEYEPLPDGKGQIQLITKNYEQTLKGGEE
ncbi:phage portal protein [Pseudolactococcus raffinolactis]|uniref:phage portal protein n=1 Tax=Pseudolactococcus raffinolactis TaxID=1366 RepID=UPI001108DDF1|nr:phage portal protein [Lactococcus raffinolactis]TLQ15427.1 phage portal protein [Lactococcus raffinolactis]